MKEHESYRGDRTQASLSAFAENLVPSAGQPHHYIRWAALLLRVSGVLRPPALHRAPRRVVRSMSSLGTYVGVWRARRGVTRMAKTSGCALSGFMLVKKVPDALGEQGANHSTLRSCVRVQQTLTP